MRHRRFRPILASIILIPAAAVGQTSGTTVEDRSADESAAVEAGFGRIPNYDFVFVPKNTLSIGVRIIGSAKVEFSGIGTLNNPNIPDADISQPALRTYDNGFVGVDQRFDGNGAPVPADGKTNFWSFQSSDQVSEDGTGINFSSSSTFSDGSTFNANSGSGPGIDIEFARQFGQIGKRFKWGILGGIAVTDINAKSRGDITASLVTLNDFFSLNGAAAPETSPDSPFTAPVRETTFVINPDGTQTSIATDISVLLADTPAERTTTISQSGAEVNGFWQVKGGYISARAGPWIEMPFGERFTLRASTGVSGRLVGAFMRFEERFTVPGTTSDLVASDQTETIQTGMFGGFAQAEAQWWLTDRSGFFAGATYEAISGNASIEAGDRVSRLNLSSGAGVRFGFTTRF